MRSAAALSCGATMHETAALGELEGPAHRSISRQRAIGGEDDDVSAKKIRGTLRADQPARVSASGRLLFDVGGRREGEGDAQTEKACRSTFPLAIGAAPRSRRCPGGAARTGGRKSPHAAPSKSRCSPTSALRSQTTAREHTPHLRRRASTAEGGDRQPRSFHPNRIPTRARRRQAQASARTAERVRAPDRETTVQVMPIQPK